MTVSEIFVSDQERRRGGLSSDRLAVSSAALRSNGYLVIRNLLPPHRLGSLKNELDAAWHSFRSNKPGWHGGGKIIGHLGLIPPKTPDFICPEIIANPLIHTIVDDVLGNGVRIVGIGGNANLPGSVDQQFHRDFDLTAADRVLVNIPLGDVDEGNGSLEVIPGSHVPDGDSQKLPLRVNTRSGDVIVRFPQVLHRGKRNPSQRVRYMLGIWLAALTPTRMTVEKLCLDPGSPDLLSDCQSQFDQLGQAGRQPVFGPNYFSPDGVGLIKEVVYRLMPSVYGFLVRKRTNDQIGANTRRP